MWNISIRLIRLDELCMQLAENVSAAPGWSNSTTQNPTTAAGAADDLEYCDWLAAAAGFDESGCGWLNTSNATRGPRFEQFQYYVEWYGITALSGAGILGNAIAMCLLRGDKVMRGLTKALLYILLVVEVFFLGLTMTYVQIRHYFTSLSQNVEVMAYVTMAMSYMQMLGSWMTYILAVDAYRSLRVFQKPSKVKQLKNGRWHVVIIFLAAALFHVAYIPHIRAILYQLDPGMYEACDQPIVKQWEFDKNTELPTNLYYVLYYALLYLLVVFFIPFYAAACRDKDIIDILHKAQDEQKQLMKEVFGEAETALLVSVICNVYLVCTVPKLAMLFFKLFDYGLLYVRESYMFFRYANALANAFMVMKSGAYLPLMLVYSGRISRQVYNKTIARFVECVTRPWRKTRAVIIMVDEV